MSLRNLRERLRRIAIHRPRHPEGFGIIIGDFNICEPEGGRFNVMNHNFSEGDAGRNAKFFRLIHLTRHFLMHFAHNHTVHITLHGSSRATQRVCVRASFHLHVVHDVCLSVRWLLSSCLSFSCFSPSFTFEKKID